MKRKIPLLIASLTGAVLIVAHVVPLAESWSEQVVAWFNILAAVALVLGGCNLMKMQLQKVAARKPGWGYAAVTVIAFVVTLVVGLGKVGVDPPERDPTMTWAGQYNEAGSAFDWIFEFVMTPLQATMFALLAFFVSSAAFRAFRAKNAEASLLLATAFARLVHRLARMRPNAISMLRVCSRFPTISISFRQRRFR